MSSIYCDISITFGNSLFIWELHECHCPQNPIKTLISSSWVQPRQYCEAILQPDVITMLFPISVQV